MSDAVEEGRPGRGVLALPLLGALLLLLAVVMVVVVGVINQLTIQQ